MSDWHEGDIILDLYEVKEKFSSGAMGLVYRVRHLGWNTDLAIKTPRSEIVSVAGGKENFVREAETWVNLGLHPHTVSCYYVRDVEGIPRVFAEYIKGGSLWDWIRDGRLYEGGTEKALERILDVSIQFAWGLQYAHEQGLVHQDVKPANVMMTPDGVAKVTDFGLAKARGMSSDQAETRVGGSVLVPYGGNTPAYCSPEQANGQSLSRKTDIWSWGVSVLEMFTGELTWMAGEVAAETLEEYLEGKPGDWKVSMPEAVAELLKLCFQHDPAQRPRGMLEVGSVVVEIYRQIIGETYLRQMPKVSKLVADSLNNRAVSLLDLGKQEEAEKLWGEALQIQPHHPEATYNRGLILWRAARITDNHLIRELEEVKKSHGGSWITDYLLGLVHLERDDAEEAVKILESIVEANEAQKELREALEVGKERLPNSRRVIRTFEGHTDEVFSLSPTYDWYYLLSGSKDNTVKLWEVDTGHCVRTFEGHERWVNDVALSLDGRVAISGSCDVESGMLKLWDVATGSCVRDLEGHMNWVSSVSLSDSGRYALSGGFDRTVRLWDTVTGRCLTSYNSPVEGAPTVCLSPDGGFAVVALHSGAVEVWEIERSRLIRTLEGHTAKVFSICPSADWHYILTGGLDRTIRLWEVKTGRCLRILTGHIGSVRSVSLSHDCQYALSGSSYDNNIKLWNIETGRCLRTFEGHTNWVEAVCLSPDGQYALSGSMDKTIKLWNVNIADYKAPLVLNRIIDSEAAAWAEAEYESHMALAHDAFKKKNFVATAQHVRRARSQPGYGRSTDAVKIWDALYRKLPRTSLNGAWEVDNLKAHWLGVASVDLSPDGTLVLSGGGDKTLKLWEVETRRCQRTFENREGYVNSVALSPDGQYALSGDKGELRLWDIETGHCLRTLKGHSLAVFAVCLSYDSRYALSGSLDGTVKLWEVKTGNCLRTLEGHSEGVHGVALSSDCRYAISGSEDATLKLWDLKACRCVGTFEGHTDRVSSVSLSHDCRCAVSGSYDTTVKLWDVATGGCMRTFEGHTEAVSSVRLSLNGNHVLSGSHDKMLKLWDVGTGRCLHTFGGHVEEITSAVLSQDEGYIVSGSRDEAVKLWSIDWELEERQSTDWDEGARPYLQTFLIQHTPYAAALPKDRQPTEEEITLALTRCGVPVWSEEDFQQLLHTLGCAGYGWLRPQGVHRQLEKMSAELIQSLLKP